jgi:hypothetical protein
MSISIYIPYIYIYILSIYLCLYLSIYPLSYILYLFPLLCLYLQVIRHNPLRVCSVQGLRDALFEAASFYRLGDVHLMEWILNCKVGTFTLCNRIYHSYVSAMDAGLKGLMAVMKAPPLACLGTFIGCNPILAASDTVVLVLVFLFPCRTMPIT